MKLYCFPVAPNPTKVRLYVAEKRLGGADLHVEEVQVHLGQGEQSTADFLARNPFGRLPVLELADGTRILESLAIIEYLEELHPDPPMIGSTPEERARTRSLERMIDIDLLMGLGRIVHATNSPLGRPPSPEVAEWSRASLPTAFGYVNRLLGDDRPFLLGDTPSVADCTLAAALQFGRFGKVLDLADWPHVERWDLAYREREPARSVLVT